MPILKAVNHHEISWSTMGRAVVVVAGTWIALQLLPVVLVLVAALFLVSRPPALRALRPRAVGTLAQRGHRGHSTSDDAQKMREVDRLDEMLVEAGSATSLSVGRLTVTRQRHEIAQLADQAMLQGS
jgi:hypothetical protein